MAVTVKFCENNLVRGTEKVIEKLRHEMPTVHMDAEPCLGHCGECAEELIAIVDENLVTADTSALLFERITNLLPHTV